MRKNEKKKKITNGLELISIRMSILLILIINPQCGSPAAGTCQDERHGLETEREKVKRLGIQYITCSVAREDVCVRVFLRVCDLHPTLLSGPVPSTAGRHPDLFVHVCVLVFLLDSCGHGFCDCVWRAGPLEPPLRCFLRKHYHCASFSPVDPPNTHMHPSAHRSCLSPPYFMSKNRPFSQWSLCFSKQEAVWRACALG